MITDVHFGGATFLNESRGFFFFSFGFFFLLAGSLATALRSEGDTPVFYFCLIL